tara:strand:- start:52 stop:429 length:378 start_codon:yes stop_codon:yes gene_type:complete
MPSVPTDDLMALIVKTVEDYLRRSKGGNLPSGKWNGKPTRSHYAISNTNIAAATDGITDPRLATVEILNKNNSTGNLERSGITHTLTHRYENIEIPAYSLIRIKYAQGEWMLEAADCDSLGNPPA